MRFTTILVTRPEWHEMNGLARWRETRAGNRRRNRHPYQATDDRVINAQAELGMSLEPGNRLGEYVQSAEKPKNPLDDEVNS